MYKQLNQKAWLLVLPVVALVAFNAIIPLMTVVNYSVQETFGDNMFFWAGVQWFEQVLTSTASRSLLRQCCSPAWRWRSRSPWPDRCLSMPRGAWVSVCLVTMALAAADSRNVVGAMWNIFALPGRIGLMAGTQCTRHRFQLRASRSAPGSPVVDGCLALDVAGCAPVLYRPGLDPERLLSGAKTRRRRLVGVPLYPVAELRRVLTIAILLRFMDSFMIYTG
jgi:glycerol transport system permease protein